MICVLFSLMISYFLTVKEQWLFLCFLIDMLAQVLMWHTQHSPSPEQTTFGYSLSIMTWLLSSSLFKLGNAVIINFYTYSKWNSLAFKVVFVQFAQYRNHVTTASNMWHCCGVLAGRGYKGPNWGQEITADAGRTLRRKQGLSSKWKNKWFTKNII